MLEDKRNIKKNKTLYLSHVKKFKTTNNNKT